MSRLHSAKGSVILRSRPLLLLAVFFILVALSTMNGQDDASSAQDQKPAETPKPAAPHFVLMFTGSWHGKLEPCTCADNMLGGIDRRSEIINAIAKPSRLLLDTGSLIENESRQSELKFETLLYGMSRLKYDAIGLTPGELKLKDKLALDPDELPPVIVSNLTAEAHKKLTTLPFLEKTLTLGKDKLECLILALPATHAPAKQDANPAPILTDPIEAIKRVLKDKNLAPDKPSNGKLVILLLAEPAENFLTQLRDIRALDLIVQPGYGDEPEFIRDGDSHLGIVTTGKLGKYIARIDLPVDPEAHMESVNFTAVAIHEHFPLDKAIAGRIQEYLDILQIENLVQNYPRLTLDGGNAFVGSEECSSCHEAEYKIWEKTAHSHAMKTLHQEILGKTGRQFDPECVACHSVGMKFESGYLSMADTDYLAGVGCEMCHGPGLFHVDHDKPGADQLNVAFLQCIKCHDFENDPTFDQKYHSKFEKIKHWDKEPHLDWHPQ